MMRITVNRKLVIDCLKNPYTTIKIPSNLYSRHKKKIRLDRIALTSNSENLFKSAITRDIPCTNYTIKFNYFRY